MNKEDRIKNAFENAQEYYEFFHLTYYFYWLKINIPLAPFKAGIGSFPPIKGGLRGVFCFLFLQNTP